MTGDAVDYATSQREARRFPEIPAGAFERSVQLVDETGQVHSGAEAVFLALSRSAVFWARLPLAAYRRVPGARAVSEAVYAAVAGNRVVFSWATYLLWGEDLGAPTFGRGSRLFVGAVGLSFVVAFGSVGPQLAGLVGDYGISPAEPALGLGLLSAAGGVAGLGLAASAWILASRPSLARLVGVASALAAWGLWLALVRAGGIFLSFQWDSLLLEAGLVAAFVVAGGRAAVWGHRLGLWLLFRLMLSSGAVKLLSGDETWASLTALGFHYETQPLPTRLAWWAHQLPAGVHELCALAVLAIELVLPVFLFLPRRLRNASALAMLALQAGIALTGNYGFFNLLAAGLCLLAIDDGFYGLRPRPLRTGRGSRLVATAASVLLALGGLQLWRTFVGWASLPAVARAAIELAEPLRSVNGYGLFAVMTRERIELTLEVSRDGKDWREWPFRYKPGDPREAPALIAPHQPRLDWQMWFAALGRYEDSPWLMGLERGVLDLEPAVLALLGPSPLPADARPAQVRLRAWRYRFTTPSEREETGRWWAVADLGPFGPTLSATSSDTGNARTRRAGAEPR